MQSHLIVVGKLKDKNLEAIESNYLKRINNPKLLIHEVKARAENKNLEADVILKKANSLTSNPYIVTLTEFGKEYESPDFSKWYYQNIENQKEIIFVICGAEGPGEELLNQTKQKLSLSKMTLPHKLARVFFVEQLYRAQTIFEGHPYHN
ncbi:MAG: 23S rRNA (pseudouridine1915-N3)-methyltransferase [Bacteriovoracaceae bacterium]|jgi:23S rRNA (pseudouridine1915-N3)-methyltransferase